jgi:hypothetical protein
LSDDNFQWISPRSRRNVFGIRLPFGAFQVFFHGHEFSGFHNTSNLHTQIAVRANSPYVDDGSNDKCRHCNPVLELPLLFTDGSGDQESGSPNRWIGGMIRIFQPIQVRSENDIGYLGHGRNQYSIPQVSLS